MKLREGHMTMELIVAAVISIKLMALMVTTVSNINAKELCASKSRYFS